MMLIAVLLHYLYASADFEGAKLTMQLSNY